MREHFTRVAPVYNGMRTTDVAPVEYVRRNLPVRRPLRGADVGCGSGRYSAMILRAMPDAELECYDNNQLMLDEAVAHMKGAQLGRFVTRLADAEAFPIEQGPFDFVLSFNAVHHFDPLAFLKRVEQALQPDGKVFIYSRLPEQNQRSIWGRFFPEFTSKETRLFSCPQIMQWQGKLKVLRVTCIEPFRYPRAASLTRLVELAGSRHYSTFSLYTDKELYDAIEMFRQRVRHAFDDETLVTWEDGNVMIVLSRPEGGRVAR